MKASLINKLEQLAERHEEINSLLSKPEIFSDQKQFCKLSKEHAQLAPIVSIFQVYQNTLETEQQTLTLLRDEDEDMSKLATEELEIVKSKLVELENKLQLLLLPSDPNDEKNVYLEIRAGTGGSEAAIFAGDLFRMYSRYAESQSWRMDVLKISHGDHGGYKEIIIRLSGNSVYSKLKFESGAHRVQRVPVTESQGRIHTSACTVAVLPEAEEIEDIEIDMEDVRVDTFRASGAGGQHVNKTDSAVRLTHIPTGTVVECQNERSQHKNRAHAIALLKSRLLSVEREKQREERSATRRNLVGSGDRSERIRTYNFPQGRVTDHRINLTLYKLSYILEGDLEQIIQPLAQEYQADLLATLSD